MAFKASLLTGLVPAKLPLATTVSSTTVTVSDRSASVTVSVPLLLSPLLPSVSALAALSLLLRLITGASLVPVTVTTTSCVVVPLCPSLTVTV